MYPRFVYAFSTCVVFVTSGPLGGSADIGRKLLSYAVQGAEGSRNQGFKPSLFVVFNRFDGGDTPDFDWSIKTSTDAFLKHDQLSELQLYYETIHVVYIPLVNKDKSDIALAQIDAFHEKLREVHTEAFRRRREFRLVFTPQKLEYFLWRALVQFSRKRDALFNWAIETAYQGFQTNTLDATLRDLWVQCADRHSPDTNSAQKIYHLTRPTFENHAQFCALLNVQRHPPHGERIDTIPRSLEKLVKGVENLVLEFAPCGAATGASDKYACEKAQDRHGDHHQGKRDDGKVVRWPGSYEEDKSTAKQTFETRLLDALKIIGKPVALQTSRRYS